MAELNGLDISQLLVNNAVDSEYRPLPNVDAKYGPWNSIDDALTAVPIVNRAKGLTVGILSGSKIIEYWFESGIENVNLVKKQTGGSSTGGYTLFIANNILEDTNTNLNALYPSAEIKDMVIDASLGGIYIKYQEGKWTKLNSTILTDAAPTVTEIKEVRMLSMK